MNAHQSVGIVMIEDDEGHARLIEKNIRRAGVSNEILPFANGTEGLKYLLGEDGSGTVSAGRQLLILLDLNLPDMTGIIATIDRTGGMDYTRERAESESRSAIEALAVLPDSACRKGLEALARVAVRRDR